MYISQQLESYKQVNFLSPDNIWRQIMKDLILRKYRLVTIKFDKSLFSERIFLG